MTDLATRFTPWSGGGSWERRSCPSSLRGSSLCRDDGRWIRHRGHLCIRYCSKDVQAPESHVGMLTSAKLRSGLRIHSLTSSLFSRVVATSRSLVPVLVPVLVLVLVLVHHSSSSFCCFLPNFLFALSRSIPGITTIIRILFDTADTTDTAYTLEFHRNKKNKGNSENMIHCSICVVTQRSFSFCKNLVCCD